MKLSFTYVVTLIATLFAAPQNAFAQLCNDLHWESAFAVPPDDGNFHRYLGAAVGDPDGPVGNPAVIYVLENVNPIGKEDPPVTSRLRRWDGQTWQTLQALPYRLLFPLTSMVTVRPPSGGELVVMGAGNGAGFQLVEAGQQFGVAVWNGSNLTYHLPDNVCHDLYYDGINQVFAATSNGVYISSSPFQVWTPYGLQSSSVSKVVRHNTPIAGSGNSVTMTHAAVGNVVYRNIAGTWVSIGDPFVFSNDVGQIFALESYAPEGGTPKLYAAGFFAASTINGPLLNNIAVFDEATQQWASVGGTTQVGNPIQIRDLCVFDDGLNGPRLIAAGKFNGMFQPGTSGSSESAKCIAAFDGELWHSLRGGVLSWDIGHNPPAAVLGFVWSVSSIPYAPAREPILSVHGDFDIVDGVHDQHHLAAWHGVPDSDGDALPDSWETHGIPYIDGAGNPQCYPLPGAHPYRKDIFVEFDLMSDHPLDFAIRSQLNRVIEIFATVPNSALYPDGLPNPKVLPGIALHLDIDNADLGIGQIPLTDDPLSRWPQEFDPIKTNYFGTATERAQGIAVLKAKVKAYHYCLWGGSLTSNLYAGKAELPGNDIVIGLDSWLQFGGSHAGAVFMHELGHNLGLHHGGMNDINHKPNYLSIMNYSYCYQREWMPSGTYLLTWPHFGYSIAETLTLDESYLSEYDGLGPAATQFPGFRVFYTSGNGDNCLETDENPFVPANPPLATGPIDWNMDGQIAASGTTVRANLNHMRSLGLEYDSPPCEQLESQNDWANLKFNFRKYRNTASQGIDGGLGVRLFSLQETSLAEELEFERRSTAMFLADCRADIDPRGGGDGVVGVADLLSLINMWGPTGQALADLAPPEGDWDVGVPDLLKLLESWGPCP